MSPLEIFAVLISVLGVILTIRRNIWCWVVNIFAYGIYGYIFFEYKLYAETVLQTIFIFLAVYGLYTWQKSQAENQSIYIEEISKQRLTVQLVCTMLVGLLFGLGLHYFTDAALPLLDAQLAALSLLSTYWTSRKYIATWSLWVVVDIAYTAMFIYKELYLTAALYAVFVGLALWGWQQWLNVHKQQSK